MNKLYIAGGIITVVVIGLVLNTNRTHRAVANSKALEASQLAKAASEAHSEQESARKAEKESQIGICIKDVQVRRNNALATVTTTEQAKTVMDITNQMVKECSL